MDSHDLQRFVTAQNGIYEVALAELQRGRKESHWMWFVFPQIAGLGRSEMARTYAITGRAEARAFLEHPVLGPRLIEASGVVCAAAGTAEEVMGPIDAAKLRSSMTLFAAVADDPRAFRAVLERFWDGTEDKATLSLL